MLSIERKENLLNKLALSYKEVMELASCSRSKAYQLMKLAKTQHNGQAGMLTNSITPTSLCLVLGTSLEKELAILHKAKSEL